MFKLAEFIVRNPKRYNVRSTYSMAHKVFVYGTLKQHEPNHHWLTNPNHGVARFVAPGVTKTKYPLIIATRYNIPFLLFSPGNGCNVKGEVYEVDDVMLSKLDILEDHPNYYIRTMDDIIIERNRSLEKEVVCCWVYFLMNFKPELLNKQQFENYSSSDTHGLPYMERSKRDPTYNYYPEVKK
ncbi:putative gamma-glutamylcyclotransferase CG2811 isoform X2 [Epargyreus clarus]|uniref:putative gamma-glutamylcyclotransferase CG2811 isoform X2 n=2 Tax=Epargyreus clarus TaxID=520877 RepID=UPI003C30E265